MTQSEVAEKYVALLGLGFHPDTRGADYTDGNGDPVFTPEEAAQYEADIEDHLLPGPLCPYDAGLQAMKAAGLLAEYDGAPKADEVQF